MSVDLFLAFGEQPKYLEEQLLRLGFGSSSALPPGVRNNRFLDAYRYFYQAGWDIGLASIADYEEVLSGLCRTSTAAGCHALAAIAELHLRRL